MKKVINASGHPLAEEAREILEENEFLEVIDIDIPNVTSMVDEAMDTAREIARRLGDDILTGKYVIIPPNYAPFAVALMTVLHGISGHFPDMIYLKRVNGIFLPESVVDLEEVRYEGRGIRFEGHEKIGE